MDGRAAFRRDCEQAMNMISVSEEALASIQRMAADCEADARRWRHCVAYRFPEPNWNGKSWMCVDATDTAHFAPTAAEAVDLAMGQAND